MPLAKTRVPLVEIEWVDAAGGARMGWRPLKEIVENARLANACAAGYLLKKTRDFVVIVPHIAKDANGTDGDGELVIPRKWVKIKPVPGRYREVTGL